MSQAGRSPRRPAIRRDADGVTSMAPNWESLTERLIREAQDRGEFEGLPGHGRPLQLDDDPREGDMGLAFHMLRNARVAPPWIEADRHVRAALDSIEHLLEQAHDTGRRGVLGRIGEQRLRDRLDGLMETHDASVTRLNAAAPSLALHRRPLDRDEQRARLAAAVTSARSRRDHPDTATRAQQAMRRTTP